MGAPDTLDKSVILFDGVCNLCNSAVQFIIKRDFKNQFLFAALQSEYGQEQLRKLSIPAEALESIVLIKGERFFQRSNAVLEISRNLNGIWPAFFFFKIIPRFIRDWVYNGIAINRYNWFGKKDQCMIPTAALEARFLD